MSVRNIPMFWKVFLLLCASTLLTLGATVFATNAMQTIGDAYSASIEHEGRATLALSRANRWFQASYGAIGNLTLETTEEGNRRALKELADAEAAMTRYFDEARAAGSEFSRVADKLQTLTRRVLHEDCANTIKLGQGTTDDENMRARTAMLAECQPKFAPAAAEMTAANNQIITKQDSANAALREFTARTKLITFVTVITGLATLFLLSFIAVRSWLSKPVQKLTDAMERLAGNDNTVEVPDLDRKDELGAMARTVEVFKAAALDKLRLEAEAAALQRAAEEERARNEAIRADQTAQQTEVVEALAHGLGRMSEGDLTHRLEQAFAAQYEGLRADFNTAVERTGEALRSIVDSAHAIRSGTGEIAQAADDLSRRTEQQAASLEETAAALEEITTTVKHAAEGAGNARIVVAQTRSDAEASGEVVRQAVGAMSEIEKSAQQVSQIIGVIDEIAFQTNLLALNAGVEAARAGDAGRGFAVVASEVRALAQRSAEAAKEIKSLIAASTQQVGSGVKLVGETGASLRRIVDQVGELDGLVGALASSAKEQAIGLAEVNTAVNQMDKVTQQNAAMVEQSTAASRTLANETETLAGLTARFNLGQSEGGAGFTATVAPPQRAKPARDRVAAAPAPRRRPAVKLAAVATQQDEWQEF